MGILKCRSTRYFGLNRSCGPYRSPKMSVRRHFGLRCALNITPPPTTSSKNAREPRSKVALWKSAVSKISRLFGCPKLPSVFSLFWAFWTDLSSLSGNRADRYSFLTSHRMVSSSGALSPELFDHPSLYAAYHTFLRSSLVVSCVLFPFTIYVISTQSPPKLRAYSIYLGIHVTWAFAFRISLTVSEIIPLLPFLVGLRNLNNFLWKWVNLENFCQNMVSFKNLRQKKYCNFLKVIHKNSPNFKFLVKKYYSKFRRRIDFEVLIL